MKNIPKRLNRLLREATKEALKSQEVHRVGAVVFRGSSVIGRGYNSVNYLSWARKTHKYPVRHAEMSAINNLNRDILNGAGIFVVRVTRKGNLSCAKPCKECLKKLLDSGITKIYYTDFNGLILKLSVVNIDTYTKDTL